MYKLIDWRLLVAVPCLFPSAAWCQISTPPPAFEDSVAAAVAPSPGTQQNIPSAHRDLRVGHWVRIKGRWTAAGTFQAESVEVRHPEKREELIGAIDSVQTEAQEDSVLQLLGQPIMVNSKTDQRGIRVDGEHSLEGIRVKVEGYWRDAGKFSARKVERREKGRDRIEGAIRSLEQRDGLTRIQVMRWPVDLPHSLEIESEQRLSEYPLAEITNVTFVGAGSSPRERDDDDLISGRAIGPDLWAGMRLEWTHTREENFNLDSGDAEDRVDDSFPVRAEIIWAPSERMYALFGYRHQWLARSDDDDGEVRRSEGEVTEAFAYLRDVFRPGLDLQVGRQDFDERREWLYDENLDAVRWILRMAEWRFELAYASIWFDGSPSDEGTDTWILSAENEASRNWSWGAYAIQRTSDLGIDQDPLHLGLRSYGEWSKSLKGWAELSTLHGDRGNQSLKSQAFDLGITWRPRGESPWYFTAGYAHGSGDPNPSDDTDRTFRQTGLQDNNDKFGGVTSFRYYGEVIDPELSNLAIWTVGVGRRIGERNSLDLVLHQYQQDELLNSLADTDLDADPTGLDRDLGWEADLIFGSRSIPGLDIELIVGKFFAGDAFGSADDAWLAKVQIRLAPF